MFDQKVMFNILYSKESAKGSTANTTMSTKLDLMPLHTFLETSMTSLSPHKSGLFQKKVKYGNNYGANEKDRKGVGGERGGGG